MHVPKAVRSPLSPPLSAQLLPRETSLDGDGMGLNCAIAMMTTYIGDGLEQYMY